MTRMRRRMLICVAGAAIVGAVFVSVTLYQAGQRALTEAQVYFAALSIAGASLQHLRETGEVQNELDALVKSGMLIHADGGKRLRSGRRGVYPGTVAAGVRFVHLKFPASADGYTLRDGRVVAAIDGAPATVIDCERLSERVQASLNEALALQWYLILTGQEQPDEPARPTSAPSGPP